MDDEEKTEAPVQWLEGDEGKDAVKSSTQELVKLAERQADLLEKLVWEIRIQGAESRLQFGWMATLAIAGGVVAVNGILMASVLWLISQSTGWERRLWLGFMAVLLVLLLRLIGRYGDSLAEIRGMLEDLTKLESEELSKEELKEILQRAKTVKKSWLERLLGR